MGIINTLWFADITNFLAIGKLPLGLTNQQRKKLIYDAKVYLWEEPFLWKLCNDGMIRRCVPNEEIQSILHHFHGLNCEGHFGYQRITFKVLESGFY